MSDENTKLDQSLEDIIGSDNANRKKRRGGGGGGNRGNRGGGGGNRRPNNQNNNNNRRPFRNPLDRRNNDDDQGDDDSGPMRRGRQQFRNTPYNSAPIDTSSQSWSHDMYASQNTVSSYVPPVPTVSGDTVFVSNLANDINDDDLLEIFGRIGNIVRANVNFNSSGNSLGSGEVQFNSGELAELAVKELDGAQVDGKPMAVKLVASISRPRSVIQRQPPPQQSYAPPVQQFRQQRPPQRNYNNNNTNNYNNNRNQNQRRSNGYSNNNNNNNRRNSRGGSSSGRGGGGGGRRRNEKQEAPSQEDLDAELEKYQAARSGSSSTAASAASSDA